MSNTHHVDHYEIGLSTAQIKPAGGRSSPVVAKKSGTGTAACACPQCGTPFCLSVREGNQITTFIGARANRPLRGGTSVDPYSTTEAGTPNADQTADQAAAANAAQAAAEAGAQAALAQAQAQAQAAWAQDQAMAAAGTCRCPRCGAELMLMLAVHAGPKTVPGGSSSVTIPPPAGGLRGGGSLKHMLGYEVIGAVVVDSRNEIGDDEIGAGARLEIGDEEVGGPSMPESGYPENVSVGEDDMLGDDEIGAATAAAVKQVVKTARDNRQPSPPMKAVPVESPVDDSSDLVTNWFSDISESVGECIGAENPFPLMTKLLTRFGAGQEKPRYVRVDTEESYKQFRAANSPEMAEMHAHLEGLVSKLETHMHDPNAHADLAEAIDEAEMLGADVKAREELKTIEMWLPERFRDKIHAWKEGGMICASIMLPGVDGEIRICTSITPVVAAVEEMERHAAASGVDAGTIVGMLPAMGCCLGAGGLVKEMAAAAPALLSCPEAAGKAPFVVRVEPKANPAICALTSLLVLCAKNDPAAKAEWEAIVSAASKSAPPYVAQALTEAKSIFLQACKAGKKAA